ncbi:DUF4376 domain-containing protein [Pseudomonas luteola]
MNETFYYVDADGRYLGGFAGAEPPKDAVQVPDAPSDARQVWNGSGWSDPVIVPTTDDVDAERDRRIDAGFTFNGKEYQTRQTDRENIAGAAQIAFMAIVDGAEPGNLRWADPESDYVWIAMDNSLVTMDAQTVVDFGKAAAARKTQLIYAARELKNMQPIPDDYTDDKWWP